MSAPPSSAPPLAPDAVLALPPIPPFIAEIAAPVMFSVLFNWWLYGIFLVQVYMYHLHFSDDKRSFKILVYFIFIVNTAQTAMMGVDAWYWFCDGFGNILQLSKTFISPYDTPIMGAILSVTVQWFFCYRIYSLSKSYLLAGFIALVSLMGGTASVLSGIRGAIVQDFAIARAHIDTVALYIWLIGTAVADILLAGSLTFLLLRTKNNAVGKFRSKDLVNRIVRLSVETTMVSAGLALLTLILYFALPTKSYFICPTGSFGKVYSIALLMTFNNRPLKHTDEHLSGMANSLSSPRTPRFGYDTEMGGTLVNPGGDFGSPLSSPKYTKKISPLDNVPRSPPPSGLRSAFYK